MIITNELNIEKLTKHNLLVTIDKLHLTDFIDLCHDQLSRKSISIDTDQKTATKIQDLLKLTSRDKFQALYRPSMKYTWPSDQLTPLVLVKTTDHGLMFIKISLYGWTNPSDVII